MPLTNQVSSSQLSFPKKEQKSLLQVLQNNLKEKWISFLHPDIPILEWKEIEKHKTEDDCYVVVHCFAYDVSDFISHHPAGKQAILRYAGTDCTRHYEFHSTSAKKLWETSKCVGRIHCCR
eukprot:c252_g1_i1.p1 GENE.c252_g1_i1~~c252_g1_i1.p1  ORF type:complete len:121 (-),score=34.57 c252_g1_i1:136-498(-)